MVKLGLYVGSLFCVGEYAQGNVKIIPYIDVVTSFLPKVFFKILPPPLVLLSVNFIYN
jgi:hypothetical protein